MSTEACEDNIERLELRALSGDNFAKGYLFERFVINLLPEDVYTIISATSRRDDLGGRIIESALDPDFRIRHEPSSHVIWLECKYRSYTYCNKVQWCKHHQLERYNKFQEVVKPEKVYIIVGLGGEPSNPKHLFCIPLDNAKYPGLYPDILEPFEHDQMKPFVYTCGRLH